MPEEAIADSGVESTESESSFDMDSGLDQMSQDLFPNSELDEEVDSSEEEVELDMEMPDDDAKTEPKEDKKEEKDEKEEKSEKSEKDEEKPDEDKSEDELERPTSWKKDMEETWKSMSKEAKEYVLQRENQMKEGLSINKQDSDLGLAIRDVMTPYEQLLQQNGVDGQSMVKNLLQGHMSMMTAPPEQKKDMLLSLAKNYGIDLNTAVSSEEESDIDPVVKNLRSEIDQMKSYMTAQQQREYQRQQHEYQQESTKIIESVNDFAQNNPHFDELSDEISAQVSAGKTLEDAYRIAFRNSDYYAEQLRQETADKLREEQQKKAEQTQQASSVNVKSRDTGKAPTASTGSMDDTMRETMRAIKNRNS